MPSPGSGSAASGPKASNSSSAAESSLRVFLAVLPTLQRSRSPAIIPAGTRGQHCAAPCPPPRLAWRFGLWAAPNSPAFARTLVLCDCRPNVNTKQYHTRCAPIRPTHVSELQHGRGQNFGPGPCAPLARRRARPCVAARVGETLQPTIANSSVCQNSHHHLICLAGAIG